MGELEIRDVRAIITQPLRGTHPYRRQVGDQ